jgi:NADH-quinone oxidoreductase subunit C
VSQKILDRLIERFGDAVLATSSYRGDDCAVVKREKILDVLRFLKEDPELAMDLARDLTVIDWMYTAQNEERPRFEVVYTLYSLAKKHAVRLKAPVPEDDPVIDSCAELWPGLNWYEREAWDMYGVRFRGHPDLRRMFMYESFVGHPLRKDYPKEKRQPLVRREGMT